MKDYRTVLDINRGYVAFCMSQIVNWGWHGEADGRHYLHIFIRHKGSETELIATHYYGPEFTPPPDVAYTDMRT